MQGIWKVRDGKICECAPLPSPEPLGLCVAELGSCGRWRDYAEGSMFQAQLEGKGKDYWPE